MARLAMVARLFWCQDFSPAIGRWVDGINAACVGFAPFKSGITLNVGCTNDMVDRLADRVRVVAARSGRPVSIVGWSRGGTLAKLVAMRQPEDVAGIVTLVSPNANPLAVSNVVVRQLRVLNRLNDIGARRHELGLHSW